MAMWTSKYGFFGQWSNYVGDKTAGGVDNFGFFQKLNCTIHYQKTTTKSWENSLNYVLWNCFWQVGNEILIWGRFLKLFLLHKKVEEQHPFMMLEEGQND